MRSERHWIRDTNHTAADQPCAASRQGNRDAEATISNSSSKRDHRQRGGDESTFEHAHVQLVKHDLRLLEQETQQKLQEIRTTSGQLPTKTCAAEGDGGHERNRSPIFGCEELPTMMFRQIVFSFRKTARVTRWPEDQPAHFAGCSQQLCPPNCKTAAQQLPRPVQIEFVLRDPH